MFTGIIYSAHIFDKALDEDEVKALIDSETARGK